MKNSIKTILIVLLLSVTLTNCKKDKIKGCTDSMALNFNSKAEENDGSCVYDACYGITCLNNGVCVDGICQCPIGYSGSHCENQVTPSSIFLTKITVTNFNQNGDPDETYPDIYISISHISTLLYSSSNYYNDATSPGNFIFTPPSPINLGPTDIYTVQLWDYEIVGADDLLETATFFPYSSTGGFPNTIVVTNNLLSIKLDITYLW